MTRSSKFIAFLISFGVVSVALAFAKLTGEEYVDVSKFIVGAFILGNVGAKFAKREGEG
jgi:hypothetical protein